jgi:hypothetical protein
MIKRNVLTFTNIWKLNTIVLNNQLDKEPITWKFGKYNEINEDEITAYQIYSKEIILKEKFTAINIRV